MSILDHIGFPVSDFARSRAFYEAALAPLGIKAVMEVTAEETGGRGPLRLRGRKTGILDHLGTSLSGVLHVAFTAGDRKTVDAFHAAALTAGATDNGAPGLRPHYHPDYYAAFVTDPDGHNIEAVCHRPAA